MGFRSRRTDLAMEVQELIRETQDAGSQEQQRAAGQETHLAQSQSLR